MTLIKSKVKEMPNSKEDGEWQCSKCGKRLTSKRNLQNHKDKKNNCNETVIATVVADTGGKKRFECSECGKQFSLKQNFIRHRKSFHSYKNVKYPCKLCDYEAAYKNNLATHVLAIHERKRFNCDTCDADFSTKSNMLTHVKTVHERVTYKCETCEFKSSVKCQLREHERTAHAGARYKCKSCEKEFKVKGYLAKHVQTVHERDESYKCPKCNFTTHNSSYV